MLLLVCSAQFLVVQDYSLVTIALPELRIAMRFSDAGLQWVMGAYSLSFAALLLPAGRLADLYGRRRLFILGATLIAAGSLVAGLAGEPGIVVVGRAVQGAGAGVISPAAIALIAAGFRDGPQRTRAFSVYGSVMAAGLVAGMVLGGVIVTWTSWRWTLLLGTPLAVAAALLAGPLLPEIDRAGSRAAVDLPGMLLGGGAVLLLVFALARANDVGWLTPGTGVMIGASAIATVLFVGAERHSRAPLVPPRVFARPNVLLASSTAAMIVGTGFGATFIVSLYLRDVLGLRPLEAGLAFSSLGLAAAVMSPVAPRLIRRWSPVATMSGGLGLQGVGLLLAASLGSSASTIHVFGAIAVFGAGHVTATIACTVVATGGVPDGSQGVVGGILTTAQQVGGSVGLAALVAVATASSAAVSGRAIISSTGYRAALLGAGLAALVASAAAMLASGRLTPLREKTTNARRSWWSRRTDLPS
jgi:MFS family permease